MNKKPSPDWYRKKSYIHFDSPLALKNAVKLVNNTELITKHSFYPFIKNTLYETKIIKENGNITKSYKERSVLYSSHADSHIYSFYSKILYEKYEVFLSKNKLKDSVLAFRKISKNISNKNKCNIDFAHQAFKDVSDFENCIALVIDIHGFFDNLNHKILKEKWIDVLSDNETLPKDHYCIYKSLTKYAYVLKEQIYENLSIPKNNHNKLSGYRYCKPSNFRESIRGNKIINKNTNAFGIPQGSPISGVLSNIYMMDFDKKIHRKISEIKGKYYRYCDDMLFIISKNDLEDIKKQIDIELKKLNLDVSHKKTQTCEFINGTTQKPLQYLGFLFDGKKIILRSKCIAKYLRKMRKAVKLANATRRKYNKKNKTCQKIYRRKIHIRYSHKGKMNFIQYGHRAAKLMQDKNIKKQIRPLWKKLCIEIDNANND